MNNSNSAIKSIGELKGSHFLVEDYQRGYKWTATEVKQLLDDINDFEGESFYCLQPVVVKTVKDDNIEKIELIDGQQRMTTIYIILSFLNQKEYSIDYRTRKSSSVFLNNINDVTNKTWADFEKTIDDNIDNYHFFTAYKKVKEWFEHEKVNANTFLKKLNNQVKVIWYEVKSINEADSKQESIRTFTRLNNGKIGLTNAELIKALFLINVDEGKNAELLQLKQNEIAQQWDSIEYALQNDAFWYFLSNENPKATRIELIFDLIVLFKEDKKEKEGNNYKDNQNKQDKLYTFLKYNDDFREHKTDKNSWVQTEWDVVYKTFLTLQEWYEDRKLYHLIGFLVCSNMETIAKLHKEYKEKQLQTTKKGWIEHIENKIRNEIKDYKLEDFKYKENNDKINRILLLHNIETELKNRESNNKYPFDRHKHQDWSLEHIHAQNQDSLKDEKSINAYVNDFVDYIKNVEEIEGKSNEKSKEELTKLKSVLIDLKNKLEAPKPHDKDYFQEFLSEAKQLLPDLFNLHTLDNMALISREMNSSIGNGFFNQKREKIIEFDKQGKFIPICTKNVFLKYYNGKENKTSLFYWSTKDRKDYLDNIKNTLEKYIPYVENNN